MTPRSEYHQVELPFIQQLQILGWDYLQGDVDVPALTERESFRQVLLTDRLRQALRAINQDENGQPWLDDQRLTQAVNALERLGQPSLLENNQAATRLLIKGTHVPGLEGQKPVPIQYIDYDHPKRNDFLVINQFRVDPPWATRGRDYVIPDLVLFVNGIPLVVVEAKRSDQEDPLTKAITQLLRYSNQRFGVTESEGAERLFRYAQLTVATCFEAARVGTVGAQYEHYLEWKDPYPQTDTDIAAELGLDGGEIEAQQRLVGGLLRPEHLLDVIQNFTLFDQKAGKLVKIVPRYQQFRATHKAIQRLQDKTAKARNGIVWHTQGSGKSLTMVFLIRKMRNTKDLKRYKIVLITDRTKLEDQLTETAQLTNEPLERADSIPDFQDLLRQPGAGLVFGMIQKMQEGNPDSLEGDDTSSDADPVLNDSEEILLLVDEAHRSHTKALHAHLMAALPNCAKIGFTGTPILEEDKKPTHAIFGSFIDTYDLKQSQIDGMTVPIRYEGRETKGVVKDGKTLDEVFADLFKQRTAEEVREIQAQYAGRAEVSASQAMIAAKARDMLAHYVTTVMPDGYKAQVVAGSREGAVRYQKASKQHSET